MSKRIDYNNDNGIAPADRAIIVPNAAPNASVASAKSSKMTKGAKIIAIALIVVAIIAIAIAVVSLIVNSYVAKINSPHYEDIELKARDCWKDPLVSMKNFAKKHFLIMLKHHILLNLMKT